MKIMSPSKRRVETSVKKQLWPVSKLGVSTCRSIVMMNGGGLVWLMYKKEGSV